MPITSDFHLHSSFSEDSHTPMEAMVLGAIDRGMKIICFTEHLDLDYPKECGTFLLDMEAYVSRLLSLRRAYRDTIDIRLGLEMGMQAHLGSSYAKIAAQYPFDFLIASQHLVKGQDPYYSRFWEGKGEEEVYHSYFQSIPEHLSSMEGFDTLGHLDYIVRYGPSQNRHYSWEAYRQEIDPILLWLIRHDKCLEVNSAGLKYGLGHPNPEESVLRRYRQLGGRLITIGSDGHRPEHIAYAFSQVQTLLLDLGFTHYCVFQNRVRRELPLED